METINYFILPIVIAETVHRSMHTAFRDSWDRLYYYGWNIILCLFSGHFLTQLVRSLLFKEILIDSISYSILTIVCYSVICFLANHAIRNFSVKVDYSHENSVK